VNAFQSSPKPPGLIAIVIGAVVCAVVVIVGSTGPWLVNDDPDCFADCEVKGTDLEDSGYLFFIGDDVFSLEDGMLAIIAAGIAIAALVAAFAVRVPALPLAVAGVALAGAAAVCIVGWGSMAVLVKDFEEFAIEGSVGWGVQAAAVAAGLGTIVAFVGAIYAASLPRRATSYHAGYAPAAYGGQGGVYQQQPQQGGAYQQQQPQGGNQPFLDNGYWWVRTADGRLMYWDESRSAWLYPPGR